MNRLTGTISAIKVSGNLALVSILVNEHKITTIVIETPKTAAYLKEGNTIQVLFKETEVVIGKGINHPISLQNRLEGTIEAIEMGDLLSKLTIKTSIGAIRALITSNAVNQLQLLKGETVTAMIKTNEIMLSQ